MTKSISAFLILICCLILCSCTSEQNINVLIFSKTVEFRHNSIEEGIIALQKLLDSKNILVDTTEDASYFNEQSLAKYAAVIFLNTTGDVLNSNQQADFERYIQAGGGFVGIHAASDTEYHWPWYNKLVGAYFDGHPAIQNADLICKKENDPCCSNIPAVWSLNEEWYNFKSINPDLEVIMTIDESSYEGGTNGDLHPIVWKHAYDGGRSFYTGIGHKAETFQDTIYLQQLWEGISYAIGDNKLDYSKATSFRIPEENRFSKTVLDFNLDEPMELDELGDRGIIYIERRGAVKLYDYNTSQIVALDTLDVAYGNEDGLLGIAVDPNYDENKWVYFFYSPLREEASQYISRFTLIDRELQDEKILLSIPVIRKCCHSGGSLEFGNDGLLYIGVGDNTNPFESAGFAPIDERPGRQLFDAQRSAANTNDLRGKILRIKPENDGTYSIPEGNLFPEGTPNCRPEIYIMGCRNPFRFSIDNQKNILYWGDVGPDAGTADSMRGPEGMGEFNQAAEAGFYGWPYSRGNNQMYNDFDFQRNQSGEKFDPNEISNNSPNNNGITSLPPIQESLIWYSYNKTNNFPWLGEGGVNPMAGPIYYADNYPKSPDAFPAYFDEKWFVYEWMRDWIYIVSFDKENQIIQADPFMPNTEFSHPMDMLFTKDGKLFMLEYGQKWNSRNLDARLSVINYNSGNRAPIAKIEVDKEVGSAPLSVEFSANNSLDFDQDEIEYIWSFDQVQKSTKEPEISYIFEKPGIFDVKLTVVDVHGERGSSKKKIMVGNDPPQIKITLSDENTTYWKNKAIDYQVEVVDLEDGRSSDPAFDADNVKVTFNYIPEGEDIILASLGHQQNTVPPGLKLINASDCKACHAVKEKVAGPSYEEIASRYSQKDKQSIVHRVIKGSQGIWGETMMAPHPQLSIETVEKMVDYILSLDPEKQLNEENLALSGKLDFDQHLNDDIAGKYILMASYLDKGNPDIENSALSAVEEIMFKAPRIEMENAIDLAKELGIWETQGRKVVGSIKDGKHIKVGEVSFENLSSISIGAAFSKDYAYYGKVEVRKGAKNGELLGEGTIFNRNKAKDTFEIFEINLQQSNGKDSLFLVFKNHLDPGQYTMNGDWVQLNYNK